MHETKKNFAVNVCDINTASWDLRLA